MSNFDRENYLNDDGLIDDTLLAHDLIQMLAFMLEVLDSAGWNTATSYKTASDKVVEHLISIYGSPDDQDDDDYDCDSLGHVWTDGPGGKYRECVVCGAHDNDL